MSLEIQRALLSYLDVPYSKITVLTPSGKTGILSIIDSLKKLYLSTIIDLFKYKIITCIEMNTSYCSTDYSFCDTYIDFNRYVDVRHSIHEPSSLVFSGNLFSTNLHSLQSNVR